jgi:tetratricopeptide (TPR) repeat protein
MKRNFGHAVLLAILAAIFAGPAISQTATVKGTCKDAQGNPITDAQVVWRNNDNGRTFTLKTDKKGEYFSLGLDPGKYTVTLSKDGKELDSVKNYPMGADEITLDFDLKKSQEQAVQDTAKKQGMTPEQVKQMQEQASNAEKYNANVKAINEKLTVATAAAKSTPPDYDKAIALMDEAVQMAPNEDLVWFRRGAIYLDSAKAQTDLAEKTKRNTAAYADLQKAVDLKKNAMASSAQAPTAGKPPASGGTADNIKMAAYYDDLGIAAGKIGKTQESVNAYNQAAELDPANAAHYYLNLGILLTNANMKGDPEVTKQAVEAFSKAIAADPKNADAYYFKGSNLIGLAKTDSSNKVIAPEGTAEAFQKYLELQPNGPHAAEAKSMLALVGSTLETTYGAKKKKN